MFECELKPYCGGNCDQCEYKEEQLTKETLAGTVEHIRKAFLEIIDPIVEFVQRFADALSAFDNRRILHLMTYHKKKRIRKKNMKRILKSIEKGGKKNG